MKNENHFSELIVADILERWPQAIPVFLRNRMYCVGCAMAPFETLTDALEIYKLPATRFLQELEQAIQPEE